MLSAGPLRHNVAQPGGETGKRAGLENRFSSTGIAGSSPAPGTPRGNEAFMCPSRLAFRGGLWRCLLRLDNAYTVTYFARIHQSLRITPAMAAGVTDHVWELEEIVALLEATEERQRIEAVAAI